MQHTIAALDPEWSLLLTACSSIPRDEKRDLMRLQLRESIRWESLFALADRHGTQPLLHQALSSVEEDVPAEEMRWLNQAYQVNLHKTLFLSRELIRIVDCLAAAGLEVMPYKGLALAEAIYGDIAMRQSGDIDLLIRANQLPRVCSAVRELGYIPNWSLSETEQHAYLKSGYECAFDGQAGRNLLEVQWAIQPRFYAIDFDMNALFQRGVKVSVAGYPMKTPSPADLLLVLSAHAAKHVWGRLVWICDIAQLMSLPALDWGWIGSQAQALGISRILRVTMLAAQRLLGASIPAAAQASLPEDSSAAGLVAEIETHIVSDATYNVESLAYFRVMMRLREKRIDRLRFLQRLILTPGPGEWKTVRLPQPLFPLYRVVRLSRLAARLVRA
jgi:hypothetical protein